eukprot:m.169048 g.169048  ORF g.169048 m.169048 type:complete len:99 (+) comp18224_c0_seq6:974-1270(+)
MSSVHAAAGATATLVDVMGTLALLSVDTSKPGVSLEINTSYIAGVKMGSKIIAEGKVLAAYRTIGFTEITIRDADSGRLMATGRHTKAFPQKRPPSNA